MKATNWSEVDDEDTEDRLQELVDDGEFEYLNSFGE